MLNMNNSFLWQQSIKNISRAQCKTNNGRGALKVILMAYNGLQHCIPVREKVRWQVWEYRLWKSIFDLYQITPNSPKWNDRMADFGVLTNFIAEQPISEIDSLIKQGPHTSAYLGHCAC